MSSARAAAIANENRSIDESQSRAIAARETERVKPRNALEIMASRLDVDAAGLKRTLTNTVFKGCSDEEFIALVIVSNTYHLNPLLREIYAFPKKGGGIQAIVAYDGWIKIMNGSPQFDGIEFCHIEDSNGNVKAVEGVIYRKDRTRPIKKMVYLKEFKRNTEPWNNSPNHMLDVRCLCHTVRLAFGVSAGIEGEDDRIVDGGSLTAVSIPSKQSLAEELNDEIPTTFDQQTGEIIDEPARDPATGMTQGDEETARALDAGEANDGTLSEDNPTAAEGPADEQRGEANPYDDVVDQIRSDIAAAKSKDALKGAEQDFLRCCGAWPKPVADEVEALITKRRKALAGVATEG